MRVKMLASVMEMPGMCLREVGQVYDVADETGAQWCAAGLAAPEPASIETATVEQPETTEIVKRRKEKRRKEKRA